MLKCSNLFLVNSRDLVILYMTVMPLYTTANGGIDFFIKFLLGLLLPHPLLVVTRIRNPSDLFFVIYQRLHAVFSH